MQTTKLLLLLAVFVSGCAPVPETFDPNADLTPPVLEQIVATGRNSVSLSFDEQIDISIDEISVEPELTVSSADSAGNSTEIRFMENLIPGTEYIIRAEAKDMKGNSMFFLSKFYGYNDSLPAVIINEFTTRGSTSHPDCVELKALAGGNLAGITFFHGTKTQFKFCFVFPSCEVQKGDFILLHTKPDNTDAEIDEITDKTQSGGKDASSNAFDFWVPKGTGLSGNNGAITLYSQPFGEVMDAVLYTNRTSESDTEYNGFGSKNVLDQAEELAVESAWLKQNESIYPEDAVFIEYSTATRSICRNAVNTDSNTYSDWHIVPTKGYTFGIENSDDEYNP